MSPRRKNTNKGKTYQRLPKLIINKIIRDIEKSPTLGFQQLQATDPTTYGAPGSNRHSAARNKFNRLKKKRNQNAASYLQDYKEAHDDNDSEEEVEVEAPTLPTTQHKPWKSPAPTTSAFIPNHSIISPEPIKTTPRKHKAPPAASKATPQRNMSKNQKYDGNLSSAIENGMCHVCFRLALLLSIAHSSFFLLFIHSADDVYYLEKDTVHLFSGVWYAKFISSVDTKDQTEQIGVLDMKYCGVPDLRDGKSFIGTNLCGGRCVEIELFSLPEFARLHRETLEEYSKKNKDFDCTRCSLQFKNAGLIANKTTWNVLFVLPEGYACNNNMKSSAVPSSDQVVVPFMAPAGSLKIRTGMETTASAKTEQHFFTAQYRLRVQSGVDLEYEDRNAVPDLISMFKTGIRFS